jgi:signal transduction histidine kinase
VGRTRRVGARSAWIPIPVYFVVIILSLLECVRVAVVSVIQRREDAWVVLVGCTLFVALNLFAAIRSILIPAHVVSHVPGWGVMALLVSVSLHLARDFAKGKQAERDNELIHAQQAALVQREKMASLSMLVAGIAHEVNTPLGAIRSAGASLAKVLDRIAGRLPEEVIDKRLQKNIDVAKDSTGIVETATDRVSEIVQRLESFAKLDELEIGGTSVETELGDIPLLHCVPRQINQVIAGLTRNALEATREGGAVRISTRPTGGHVELKVHDAGVGIEAAALPKIFDPGFTTKGVGVGAGLGLAICHQIIHDHGGTIAADSTPGEGSTFTVMLPIPVDGESALHGATEHGAAS